MPDLIKGDGSVQQVKEKLLVRISVRTAVPIAFRTYETEEEIVGKILPDRTSVVRFLGVDEFDQTVIHYMETAGKGDISCLIFVPLKGRKIVPVEGSLIDPTAKRR